MEKEELHMPSPVSSGLSQVAFPPLTPWDTNEPARPVGRAEGEGGVSLRTGENGLSVTGWLDARQPYW